MNQLTDIKAILDRVDIVSLIAVAIDLKSVGHNGRYRALCPFHNEKTPSFFVSQDKQFYHCFGCGAHGDAIDWLVNYHRMSIRGAIETLAHQAGVELLPYAKEARRKRAEIELIKDIEDEVLLELQVLVMGIGDRVNYRKIPEATKRLYPHISAPPEQPLKREYEAAKRVLKALQILYGDAGYEQ